MLLSIDRVLQLLAEGKSIQKIAELSGAEAEDVSRLIDEVRTMIDSMDKAKSRKKVILRKKGPAESEPDGAEEPDDENMKEIFEGAELHAVPLT